VGSRGPMPKPNEQLHGHRKRKPRTVAAPPVPPPPSPSEEWLPPTKEAWRVYWASALAKAVLDVDAPVIRRLFALYDQYERSMDAVRRALVVKGSTGQIRTNPLADHILKLEGVILRLENELGLTPMARVRLGIRIARPDATPAKAPDKTANPYGHLRAVV
jgi:P27 family predicted phage terminase small subunit